MAIWCAASSVLGAELTVASWVEPTAGPAVHVETVAALPDSAWTRDPARQNYGYTSRAVWFRLDLARPAMPSDPALALALALEILDPLLDRVEIHQQDRAGTWRTWSLGDKQPFSQRPLPTRHFVVPLDVPPVAPHTLYVRVET